MLIVLVLLYDSVRCWDCEASVVCERNVWSIAGMIRTGGNRSTLQTALSQCTLSTTDFRMTKRWKKWGMQPSWQIPVFVCEDWANHERPLWCCRSPCRDLKPEAPWEEARMLLALPRRSSTACCLRGGNYEIWKCTLGMCVHELRRWMFGSCFCRALACRHIRMFYDKKVATVEWCSLRRYAVPLLSETRNGRTRTCVQGVTIMTTVIGYRSLSKEPTRIQYLLEFNTCLSFAVI